MLDDVQITNNGLYSRTIKKAHISWYIFSGKEKGLKNPGKKTPDKNKKAHDSWNLWSEKFYGFFKPNLGTDSSSELARPLSTSL